MPFSPTDISGLKVWFDASDAGSITSSGGLVSQWNDKSGNAFHATQGTGSRQPTTGTRTINSLNVLDFDGTDDMLGIASNPMSGSTAGHIFYVMAVDVDPPASDTGTNCGAVIGKWGSNSNADHEPYSDSNVYHGWGSTTRQATGNPTPALTSPRLIEIWSASADWAYVIDGTTHFSTGTNTVGWESTAAAIRIGASGHTSGDAFARAWDGRIAEIIAYDSKLTGANLTSVRDYLNAKWLTPAGAITGKGAIATAGRVALNVTESLTGRGAISIAGNAGLTGTKQQLSGHGDIAIGGRGFEQLTLPITGHGDVAVTGTAASSLSLPVTGRGNIAVTGRASENTQLDLSGHGDIATTGQAPAQLSLPFTGHGDISTTGRTSSLLAVTLTGTGATSTAGTGTLSVLEGDHGSAEPFTYHVLQRGPRVEELPTVRRTHIRVRVTILTTSIWSTGPHTFTLEPRTVHRSHPHTRTGRAHTLTRTREAHACRRTHLSTDVRTEVRMVRPKSYHRELLTLASELL